MNLNRALIVLVLCACVLSGCEQYKPQYGSEHRLFWPDHRRQVWAVAPAIDLSGQQHVDPLLQADLVYQQLQQVEGITVIPVNRVIEVYSTLQIDKVQSEEQANLVSDLLGCDGLVVPTITIVDPYNPPKFGASLHLFVKSGTFVRPAAMDVRELVRSASPGSNDSFQRPASFFQAVGMFDAANGSVREDLLVYAAGRNDPVGPLGSKEYFVSMDRFCGFVYHQLIRDLLDQAAKQTASR